jgi:hypothetical protein
MSRQPPPFAADEWARERPGAVFRDGLPDRAPARASGPPRPLSPLAPMQAPAAEQSRQRLPIRVNDIGGRDRTGSLPTPLTAT